MTQVSEITGHRLSLCRKPPAFHALQKEISIPAESTDAGLPDGGSGAIRRGIGAALAGIRILSRNPQLLWFTLLAGLVFLGNIICQGALGYISWALQPSVGETEWFVMSCCIEFVTLSGLVFLTAGLFLSIPEKNGGRASFREGLLRAGSHGKTIMLWSLVLTLAGMLIFCLGFYSIDWLPSDHLVLPTVVTLFGSISTPITEFPFNPFLTPLSATDPWRTGGILPVYWMYPSGFLQTLFFSEINLLLFVMTPFVVPSVVLGKKNLRRALEESSALMNNARAEAAVCALFLGSAASGIFLTYRLLQEAAGLSSSEISVLPPGSPWPAVAVIYDIALFWGVLVIATVGVIAAREIYRSARDRRTPAGSAGAGAEGI